MTKRVGKTDPIERGLRLHQASYGAMRSSWENRPDRKGIKTVDELIHVARVGWENRPDRKGIKTLIVTASCLPPTVGKTDPIERGLRRY